MGEATPNRLVTLVHRRSFHQILTGSDGDSAANGDSASSVGIAPDGILFELRFFGITVEENAGQLRQARCIGFVMKELV